MPSPRDEPRRDGLLTWSARACLLLLIACGLYFTYTLSRHRVFQVDEVEHVHAAYEIATGKLIYRDFPQAHNPLMYAFITPVIDAADPVASFRAARWVPFVALLATALLGAFAAHRLAGEAAAWMAGGLILTHSTMVERGIEIRPDGLLALGTVAAMAIELTRWSRRRRAAAQGLVLGLTFLCTQKALFVCAGFALWWAWHAWRERRVGLVLTPALLGTLPFAVMLLWLSATGALAPYLQFNVYNAASRLARGMATGGPFGPGDYLLREGGRNLAFMGLAAVSLVAAGWQTVCGRARDADLLLTLLSWLLVATLWFNPFPFPYLHITIIPVIAILVAWQLATGWRGHHWGSLGRALLVVVLALVAAGATSLPRLARQSRVTQDVQLGILTEVQAITTPADSVFDLVGFYFRKDAYPLYWMTMPLVERYRAGEFQPLIPTLRRSTPAVFMLNYRTRSLPHRDQLFLHGHFVHLDGPVFVLGASIRDLDPSESRTFELLKTDVYRYQGPAGVLVDGAPFTEGRLQAGEHTLTAAEHVEAGRILLDRAAQHQMDARPPFEIYPPFD